MAKIVESVIVIKLSKLVKNDDDTGIDTADLVDALEQVAQGLVGSEIIVEVGAG
tara:strand:- start:3295 stop:3456 length:162 start_codon:yes stop_codon:yes gene_type:complete